ncbi:MAG TPA: PilT/PilU family type 4a pilus ATPase [Vicinamibacteria bacterium]|nr:PilT/PilU family type 4a pilus ATPase [Vicinamibacteria bacterium]
MNSKEFLSLFRDAPWESEEEIEALLLDLEPLTSSDVLRVLEILTSKWLAGDPRQQIRCIAFAKFAADAPDKELFVPFVRALKTAQPAVRATLTQLIPAVNSVADHGELVQLLGSPEAELRDLAGQLLIQVGGRGAFEMTAERATMPAFPGRAEAMEVLTSIGGQHAVPPLEAILKVGSVVERTQALGHLVSLARTAKDPSRVVAALASAIDDPSEPVRCEALAAFAGVASEADYFARAGPALSDPSPLVVRAAVMGLRRYPSARSLEALQQALRRGPNLVRLTALEVLEALATPEALPPIVEALAHRQVAVRSRAAEVLARLGRAGKIEIARTVVWLLGSRDVNVRRMAVEIAQSVPDPSGELWPKLLEYLYDEDWWVRERVIDAVVEIAGDDLVPHLFRHLRDDSDVVKRYFAVEILRRLRSPNSLGPLTNTASGDPDWLVRERAIEAIAALGDERAVPFLANLLMQRPEMRLACIQALADLKATSAAPHVALVLSAQGIGEDERLAVLRCLQSLGDRGQAPAVRQCLKDPSPEMRALALDLLAQGEAQLGPQPLKTAGTTSVLDRMLIAMAERQADDLLLGAERKPYIKQMGRTLRLAQNALTAEQVQALLMPLLSRTQRDDLAARREVDLSYVIPAEGLRFRVNMFHDLRGLSAVFRIVRGGLPDLGQLGLPAVVSSLGELKNGLVLVGGPTGSGKSTTLAALVDLINATSTRHIVTIEDPIETVHHRKQCLINQRELGTHTGALSGALRATLRQDPDVILVGEMRDPETISFGITAAETGHLVFGTVHTVSAAASVDRLINACPPEQHEHVRSLLAGSLRAVVCQHLFKRRDAAGRCLAVEVMLATEAIANLIRKGKTHQIPSVITTSRSQGMQLMDQELLRLVQEGKIHPEEAYLKAVGKKEFEPLVGAEAKPPARSSGVA